MTFDQAYAKANAERVVELDDFKAGWDAALASSDAQAEGGGSEVAPVGYAGEMPGTNGGFTMAAFDAVTVPLGSALYLSPPAECAPRADNVRIDEYAIPISKTDAITIERAQQTAGPDLWKVKQGSNCLSKSGEWEYEPMPSSRDDEFLARCRFATAAEAIDAAIEQAEKEKA